MRISYRTYNLHLEVPFAIARGVAREHGICICEVEHRGTTGYGEASPSAYYGDSLERAIDTVAAAQSVVGDDPFAVERVSEDLRRRSPSSPSGRAAVEMALYDLMGKVAGLPVYKLLGLSGKALPRTSYTVGVEDLAVAQARLEGLKGFPILKVKLGFGDEVGLLRLLAKTGAALRVDANEGWSAEDAAERINAYSREFGVEFFEQPLAKGDVEGYRKVRASTRAEIIVDESVETSPDIIRWVGLADGVNVKLMKCGGIGEALRMIGVARAVGLKVMLGCMVESSVGITAAAHLAPLADYCDLDGNLLVSNDPFQGVKGVGGLLTLPDAPGLGVAPVA